MSTTKAVDKKTKVKKVVSIVLNVILWIFLVFAFFMMVFAFASISNDYNVPILGKKVLLTVASDSMSPTFEQGDLLVGTVLSDEEKANLKEGDIITFFVDLDGDGIKELNTHRIVFKTTSGDFKTKGDNPKIVTDDPYTVVASDIVCSWKEGDTRLKGTGKVLAFLQSRIGFLCVVIIPLALFFIFEIIRFVIMLVKMKGGNGKKITAEDEEEIKRKAIEEYKKSLEAEKTNSPESKKEETDKSGTEEKTDSSEE